MTLVALLEHSLITVHVEPFLRWLQSRGGGHITACIAFSAPILHHRFLVPQVLDCACRAMHALAYALSGPRRLHVHKMEAKIVVTLSEIGIFYLLRPRSTVTFGLGAENMSEGFALRTFKQTVRRGGWQRARSYSHKKDWKVFGKVYLQSRTPAGARMSCLLQDLSSRFNLITLLKQHTIGLSVAKYAPLIYARLEMSVTQSASRPTKRTPITLVAHLQLACVTSGVHYVYTQNQQSSLINRRAAKTCTDPKGTWLPCSSSVNCTGAMTEEFDSYQSADSLPCNSNRHVIPAFAHIHIHMGHVTSLYNRFCQESLPNLMQAWQPPLGLALHSQS